MTPVEIEQQITKEMDRTRDVIVVASMIKNLTNALTDCVRAMERDPVSNLGQSEACKRAKKLLGL